jgi:hypothetical protein
VSYAPRPMLLDSFSLAIIVVLMDVSSALYVSSLLHGDAKNGNMHVTGQLTNRPKKRVGCS